MAGRPSVDVVVPFRGELTQRHALCKRLAGLQLADHDSIVVVDNTPGAQPARGEAVAVILAAELATPGYARNQGAERGQAQWLLFLDADVFAPPDLLEHYFHPAPADDAGLLAGGIVDEPVPPDGPAAARYAYVRAFMSQDDTLRAPGWGFPKTANTACRRSAFEAVGGFRADIRAAEDADLTFRLRAAGWRMERREGAAAVHRSRPTLMSFVRQKLCHGAGGSWLNRQYPGASPPRRLPGLTWWALRTATRRLARASRTRDRDDVLWALFEPLELIVHELARPLPNERPLRRPFSRERAPAPPRSPAPR